jgi:hypothetical protein
MAKEKVKAAEPEPEPVSRRRPGRKSIAEKASVWKTLASNVRDRLPDMPQLADENAEFERLIGRIESSLVQQNTLRAEIGVLIRSRAVDLELARASRSRLVALIQGRLGTTTEELRGFGLKPRKRSRIRKQIEGEPSPPEPEPEEPSPTITPPDVVIR